MSKIRLAGTVNDSIVDGPGLRFSVFMQGCPHNCKGCQNPETHNFAGGYEEEIDDLIKKIKKNPLLSGVTLSGGEPFAQSEVCAELAERVKKIGLEVAVYSGFTFEEILDNPKYMTLLQNCDVLIDGRFEIAQRSLDLKFRGSKNQRIIDVSKSLALGKAVLCVNERWV